MKWLCCAIIALIFVMVCALGTSAAFFPVTELRIDPGLGNRVFNRKCASCHSLSAGIRGNGPSLIEIGRLAGTRRAGMTATEYIVESIVRPDAYRVPGISMEMPTGIVHDLSKSELLSVAALLCARGGVSSSGELLTIVNEQLAQLQTPPPRQLELTRLERGRDLFMNELKCMHCHRLDGAPSNNLMAPSLLNVGKQSREYLKTAILNPDQHILPGYEIMNVVDADGLVHSGRQLPAAKDTIRLLQQNEKNELMISDFPVSNLEEMDDGSVTAKSKISAMPKPDANLSTSDLEALIDFVQTLQ